MLREQDGGSAEPAPQRLTDNNVLFIGDSLTNPVELTECRINGDMLHLEGC